MTAQGSRPDPESIIAELRARSHLPGFITPDYGRYCITNVAPLILENFGLGPGAPPELSQRVGRKYRHVVLLIIDALGFRLFQRCASHCPTIPRLLERGDCLPLTVTFPSTTTVALTAIYTGLSPAGHGISGHTMFVKELGGVVDILRFSPRGDRRRDVYAEMGWNVRDLFPMRTIFEPLKEAGLHTLSITRAQFQDTALGLLHHAGADVVGYADLADMLTLTRAALRAQREPGLICVYWDSIDMLSHVYGPNGDAVRAAANLIFTGLEREVLSALTPEERRDTLLLITADHGQVDVLPDEAICLDEHPDVVDSLLLPPAGQSRAPYLYALPRTAEQLPEQLAQFDDRLKVITSWQALASGLFGPPEIASRLDAKVGDVIAITRGHTELVWIDHPRAKLQPHGHHGSLSEEEMLVPLVALPLEAW